MKDAIRKSRTRPPRPGRRARAGGHGRAWRRWARRWRGRGMANRLLPMVFGLSVAIAATVAGCQFGRTGPAERRPEPLVPEGTAVAALPPARPMPGQVRAIWVARYHYQSAADVRRIFENVAAAGFNTVLWQVRGDGTVTYPSRLEPWAAQFGHQDPGFDPLALAVQEAHARNLRIEAWVNVLPGWNGPRPPPLANQLWNARPGWFLSDSRGARQPLGNFYVILNPCLPEVRAHIVSVIREIASNYAVDGVHLDYVRYAWETTRDARKRYPRDEQTLALYQADTGLSPDEDLRSWDNWRTNQLTRLVGEIRNMLGRARPGATLTAAVRPDPDDALRGYLQNAAAWVRAGLVDAVMPMAYSTKLAVFERDIQAYRSAAPRGRIIPGIGVYLQTGPQLAQQLGFCAARGGDWAAFSYEALFPGAGDPAAGTERARLDELRAGRLAAIRSMR